MEWIICRPADETVTSKEMIFECEINDIVERKPENNSYLNEIWARAFQLQVRHH